MHSQRPSAWSSAAPAAATTLRRRDCGGGGAARSFGILGIWHSASPREADIMILSVISEYFGTITLY